MFKTIFAVFITIALVACNKAENLEPLLQGVWNNSTTTGWTRVSFSSGTIVVSPAQASELRGTYKLDGKTLKLEMRSSAKDRQVLPKSATIEKVDGSTLELKLNGQTLSFARDIP
jgi:hypothetical protein